MDFMGIMNSVDISSTQFLNVHKVPFPFRSYFRVTEVTIL